MIISITLSPFLFCAYIFNREPWRGSSNGNGICIFSQSVWKVACTGFLPVGASFEAKLAETKLWDWSRVGKWVFDPPHPFQGSQHWGCKFLMLYSVLIGVRAPSDFGWRVWGSGVRVGRRSDETLLPEKSSILKVGIFPIFRWFISFWTFIVLKTRRNVEILRLSSFSFSRFIVTFWDAGIWR